MGRWQELTSSLSSLSSLSLSSSLLPLLLLSSLPSSIAQAGSPLLSTVLPSNNSQDVSSTQPFLLQSSQIQLPSGLSLAPLTSTLANLQQSQLKTLNVTGNLVNVDATNSLALTSSDVAFISCDSSAYPGLLGASSTVSNVLTSQQKPLAVLLYSTVDDHCNFTSTDPGINQYVNVFTLTKPSSAKAVQQQLNSGGQNKSASIVADMSVVPQQGTPADGGGGTSADSPNTAMIILYTITGIITALFLGIIITGAVRAHRHPERYGPRYTAGRPRQSRARGIARAMLETIPIVKFGDDYNAKEAAMKGDVEMSMGTDSQEQVAGHDQEQTIAPTTENTTMTPAVETARAPDANPETPAAAHSGTSTPAPQQGDPGNFSCPICTDDFVKGQDLRVLPCNHKFHPECVDPWLVNVSGTCPLCRIDLNPSQPEGEHNEGGHAEGNPDATQDGGQAGPTEAEVTDTPQSRHRRLSNYLHGTLNARRMHDASVEERLAALRSVREEAGRDDAAAAAEDTEERQRRRTRLTSRLRERFRIRTRPHENETSRS